MMNHYKELPSTMACRTWHVPPLRNQFGCDSITLAFSLSPLGGYNCYSITFKVSAVEELWHDSH